MKTRPATTADLPAIQALLTSASLPLDGLEVQFPTGYCVLEEDGTLRAAAGIERHGESGLLRSLVVAPDMRAKGLGRMLVAERMKWARSERLIDIYLLTTTAADFFEQLGFSRIERAAAPDAVQRSLEFASACPASAVCMKIKLA